MAHQLPALPYANNALEPHIDETTMMKFTTIVTITLT